MVKSFIPWHATLLKHIATIHSLATLLNHTATITKKSKNVTKIISTNFMNIATTVFVL